MAEIVAKRLVEHLERAGFVVMKRPADIGGAALGRGLRGLRMRAEGAIGAAFLAMLAVSSSATAQEVHYSSERLDASDAARTASGKHSTDLRPTR